MMSLKRWRSPERGSIVWALYGNRKRRKSEYAWNRNNWMLQLKESITRWQQLRRWWQEWLVLKCSPHSTLVWLLENKIGQSEFKIMHPQQSFWKICLQKTAVWNQLCWRDVLENYVPNIWRLGRWWSDCGWHIGLVGEWAATWRETGKSNAAHQRKEHTTESRELYIQS